MVNLRSNEPQYTTQTTFPDISSGRSVNHFGECEHNIRPQPRTPISFIFMPDHKLTRSSSVMYDVPTEVQDFLSDDELPSLDSRRVPLAVLQWTAMRRKVSSR
jgi:hypothetical protein